MVSASIAGHAGQHRFGAAARARRVERAAGRPARSIAPSTGGPPSIGSPRPLQTRPSQPAPTGIRSGSPVNATRAPAGSHARRCPPAPARPPGRGPPPARARAGRLAVGRAGSTANSSQPDAGTPRTTSSGPRSSRTAGVLDRSPSAVLMRSASSAASIVRRARRSDAAGVVGAGLLAGPEQRREVDLLDRRRRHPALDQRLAAVDDGEHRVDQRGGLRRRAVRVVRGLSALCCSTASRSSRPASSDDPLVPGQRADADELGQRRSSRSASASRLDHPGPPRRPSPGRRCAAYQAAERARRRGENDAGQPTAG